MDIGMDIGIGLTHIVNTTDYGMKMRNAVIYLMSAERCSAQHKSIIKTGEMHWWLNECTTARLSSWTRCWYEFRGVHKTGRVQIYEGQGYKGAIAVHKPSANAWKKNKVIHTITMLTFDKNPGILTRYWQLIKIHTKKPILYTSNKNFWVSKPCRYCQGLHVLT